MPIRLRETNNVSILDIEGNVDINSSELIEMVGWLVNTGKLNVILNLENVGLVDYSGLSILAIAYKNVLNHKGKMKLLSVPLAVQELFKVVRLDVVFEIYDDEESAVKSFYETDVDKVHLRRKYTRLETRLNVKYKISGEHKKSKTFEGDVLNISAAGIYVYTPHTFPLHTRVDLEFNLPGERISLETTGIVAWVADREIQPHSCPGMGVAFLHLTPEQEKAILEFIDKNVTHRSEPI